VRILRHELVSCVALRHQEWIRRYWSWYDVANIANRFDNVLEESRARLSIYSDHGRIAMVHPRWQSFLYRRWGLPVRRSSHSFPSTQKSMCSRLEAKGHHESIHVFLDSKKEVGVPFSSENIQHGIEWFVLPYSLSTSTSGRTPTTKATTGPIILLDRQNDLFGISDLLFKKMNRNCIDNRIVLNPFK
jgi:hypothetical protein